MSGVDLPPRTVVIAAAFARDAKRVKKRGKAMEKLFEIVELLRQRQELPPRHRDHTLQGEWEGFRDCHVEPDWILIYRLDGEAVYLARMGTHADLFR